MINIWSDIAAAVDGLDRFERAEAPFAISVAINAAVFDVRRYMVDTSWPRSGITYRNRRFLGVAMRVSERADKSKWSAAITDVLGRDALSRQADGQTRRPISGRSLAVPVGLPRLSGGAISKSLRPRTVLDKKGYFKNRKGNAIFQRLPGGKVKLVYLLLPSVRVDRHWRAYDDAETAFERVFPFEFDIAMNKALDSSFKRAIMRQL